MRTLNLQKITAVYTAIENAKQNTETALKDVTKNKC